jgi:hypothetical protein
VQLSVHGHEDAELRALLRYSREIREPEYDVGQRKENGQRAFEPVLKAWGSVMRITAMTKVRNPNGEFQKDIRRGEPSNIVRRVFREQSLARLSFSDERIRYIRGK